LRSAEDERVGAEKGEGAQRRSGGWISADTFKVYRTDLDLVVEAVQRCFDSMGGARAVPCTLTRWFATATVMGLRLTMDAHEGIVARCSVSQALASSAPAEVQL
jgi:hypothetical protein